MKAIVYTVPLNMLTADSHSVILDDPYPDPPGLVEPAESPIPTPQQLATVRIAHDEEIDPDLEPADVEKLAREREARSQALSLELMGDLPFFDLKPPENVLFIANLNQVTQSEDLELIFSRFGKILSWYCSLEIETIGAFG